MDDLKIGQVNKAVEMITEGKVAYDSPLYIPEPLLNDITLSMPNDYLWYLGSICEAMKNQRYAAYEDGTITLVCSADMGDREESYSITCRAEGDRLTAVRIDNVGFIPLPSPHVDMRKILRKRGKDSNIVYRKEEADD